MKKNKEKFFNTVFGRILFKIFSFYLKWFGVFNAALYIFIITQIDNETITILLIALGVYETYFLWFKKVVKNFGNMDNATSRIQEAQNVLIIGSSSTGKTTLANYFISRFVPDKNKQYYNYNKPGYRAFKQKHLLLEEGLPQNCGVVMDEESAQIDNADYAVRFDGTRRRIRMFNKFYGQFYGRSAYIFYLDQAEAFMNTALRRFSSLTIYTLGTVEIAAPLIPSLLFKLFNGFKNSHGYYENGKFLKYNLFGLYAVRVLLFNKLGESAEHYSLNYDAIDGIPLICSGVEFFSNSDTYVFKKHNPCQYKPENDYIWGSDIAEDNRIMDENFRLSEMSIPVKFGSDGMVFSLPDDFKNKLSEYYTEYLDSLSESDYKKIVAKQVDRKIGSIVATDISNVSDE